MATETWQEWKRFLFEIAIQKFIIRPIMISQELRAVIIITFPELQETSLLVTYTKITGQKGHKKWTEDPPINLLSIPL